MSKFYTIYSGNSLNQLVFQMGLENSATTFHYDFPKNITNYDKRYKAVILDNNDPTCTKSGETIVTVPHSNDCYCTCDNISAFYRAFRVNFPDVFDGGKQRYEVASGNTRGCGILSANTAESNMFENNRIEVVHDTVTDDYHFYATVLDNNTGIGRSAGIVIYFIPTSEISGDPQWDTACKQTFVCAQSGDPFSEFDCNIFSGLTINIGSSPYIGQTIPYTGQTSIFARVPTTSITGSFICEYSISNDKGLSLTSCGNVAWIGGLYGTNLFTIPPNTSHSTILWTISVNMCFDGELEEIPLDDPNLELYDEMSIAYRVKNGYPCEKTTINVIQEGLPPCTCSVIELNQAKTHTYNSYSYYATGETTQVIPNAQMPCYSAESIRRVSGYCSWLEDVYIVQPTSGSSATHVHYYLYPNFINNDSEDWECTYEIFYKNLEGGEDCVGYLTFVKEHNDNPPEECTCKDVANAVNKPSLIPSSGGTYSTRVITTGCGAQITGITWSGTEGAFWGFLSIGDNGRTLEIGFYPNNSTDSRSGYIEGTAHTTTLGDCEIKWNFIQEGKCGCSVAKIYQYSSMEITEPIQFNYDGQKTYGKFSRACTVTLNSKPNWIDVNINGENWDVVINSNAGTSTGLSGTITFDVDGVLCNNIDLPVKYDYECNCDYASTPEISQITTTIPSSGGTDIFVGTYVDYYNKVVRYPCIEATVSSTSAFLYNIRIDAAGNIYCNCNPNTSSSEQRPHIDVNIINKDDGNADCRRFTYIELVLQGS